MMQRCNSTRKRRNGAAVDRFSCLPNEVVIHILSFLPTRLSVQTSTLSKRWRFLWAHVPFLGFDVSDPDYCNVVSETITHILLHHKHDIHTVLLRISGELCDSEETLASWIANLTARNIRNLFIKQGYAFYNLPPCLFTCKTLVDLSLSTCGYIPISAIYLPALKKLKLDHFEYESHESLAHLLFGCPVLEELIIEGNVLGHCCVSSPTLTRLVLLLKNDEVSNFGLELDAPALRYLQIDCSMPDKLLVGALDSLIEADIYFYWDEPRQDNFTYSRNVLALVDKLYNVKLLRLLTDSIAMIQDSAFLSLAIKFQNLTKLCVGANMDFITCFLESANKLQIFELIHTTDEIDNQYCWMEPKQVPACLISHLQTVNLHHFDCSKNEFDMVRYILMNAKVLKMMEVHNRDIVWNKELEILRGIAFFERGSQECQLVLD